MKRGPKPMPTALRHLTGNPSGRPMPDDEPSPPPLADPPENVPAEIAHSRAAAAEWHRVAPMLQLVRVITEADRSALIALCLEWARYLDATKKVADLGMVVKAPSGYPMVNPYLSIATKALAGCGRLWTEFGMTPSSRSRVSASAAPAIDGFEEFDRPVDPVNH